MLDYQDTVLYHHGVKGMRWGVRKYQNLDGTLTADGKKRYSSSNISSLERKADSLRKSGDFLGSRKIKRSLRKIKKQRDYIDKDFAFTTLKDLLAGNKHYKTEMEIHPIFDDKKR